MIIQIMIDGQIEESGKSSFTPPSLFHVQMNKFRPIYMVG